MYKIELLNGSTREIIHHPAENAPYVLDCRIDEEINTVTELTVTVPVISQLNINLYKTMIVVTKLDTGDEVFKGRIIKISEDMSESGEFTKEITAESLLGILNDTYIRNYIKTTTPKAILTHFLNKASSSAGYTFKAGNVEDYDEEIAMETNYETVLSAVLNLAEITGKQLQLREVGTTLYIDLLNNIGNSTPKTIQMGTNMLSITKELDTSEFSTRVIPLAGDDEGNTLTISKINNGKDYIQDDALVEQYGVIERVVEDMGTIKDAKTLLKWGKQQLTLYKNIKLILECSAIDLAYLSGTDIGTLELGDAIQLINNPLGINVIVRITAKNYSIFEAYNPTISLSSRKFRSTDQIIDIRNRQRIKNRASVLNTQSQTIEDNITKTKPITEEITISGTWEDATLDITTSRYKYYTEEGESYTTYPENLNVIINGITVATYENAENIEDIVNIATALKAGTNTIKITSTKNGHIKGVIRIKSRA